MNREILKQYLEYYSLDAKEETLQNLCDLCDKTLETNEKFNLTSITDKSIFFEKMILDSALGMCDIDLTHKDVIDVGTGAGFPGLVLYILNPSMNLTLLDSTKKKINYLDEYCHSKNYRIKCVSDRAEDYAKKNIEKYDFAYARAVSSLPVLLELILPMLKVGGCFIALKGKDAENEIKDSAHALKVLNCEIMEIKKYVLPESKEERNVIIIKKKKETNKKYPRLFSIIKERPL